MLVVKFHNPHFFETALSAFAGYSAIPLNLLNRIIGTLMNCDDRMGSCRDKGRMWGRVGAWCLSWWQRDPVGTLWSTKVAPQPGQAPGPLIHSTPPLVPTGPWAASTSMARIPRFGRQHSSREYPSRESEGAEERQGKKDTGYLSKSFMVARRPPKAWRSLGVSNMPDSSTRQNQLAAALQAMKIPPRIQLRCWTETDFPAIQRLSTLQGWPTSRNRPAEALFAWQHSWPALVITEEENVIGFVRGLTDGEITTYIAELLIDPKHRGKGLARLLLDACNLTCLLASSEATYVFMTGLIALS